MATISTFSNMLNQMAVSPRPMKSKKFSPWSKIQKLK